MFINTSEGILNKTPFGSVKTEERVSVSIKIEGDFDSIYLLLYQDNCDIYRQIPMSNEKGPFECDIHFEKPGIYFYRFMLIKGEERVILGKGETGITEGEFSGRWEIFVHDKIFETPKKFYGGIMYQIFPDRFCKSDKYTAPETRNKRKYIEDWYAVPDSPHNNSQYSANDFFGGNIEGIIERIPYLKELNVDIIYLNPIFESAENHRYSTSNYYNIDPVLGTNESFVRLAEECEKNNIKLIIDGVFSHTGADSIYFNKYNNYDSEGAYNSKDSQYYNWYNFKNYPDEYECWWGFKNLPNVNETESSYMEYITKEKEGVLNFWQEKGASGWRLDVADELPDEFLDNLRISVKRFDKDALIIGEVWENAARKESYGARRKFLRGNQLDTVMNYPWRSAIINYIKNKDAKCLWQEILDILESYPYPAIQCLMNLLSSHDTVRIITELSGVGDIPAEKQGDYVLSRDEYLRGCALLMPATFLQFTLPGIPCIYYGDEIGMYGFRDPFSRKSYAYGKEDLNILEFFKKITKARSMRKEDFSSDFRFVTARDGLFAFWRGNSFCVINVAEKVEEINTEEVLEEAISQYAEYDGNKITLYPMSFGIYYRGE